MAFTWHAQRPLPQPPEDKRFVIYSKPGCHLCEGLKEKLSAVLDKAAYMPSVLSGYIIEERDITTDPEWMTAYGLVIPVVTTFNGNGDEVKLPRAPPRISAERLQRHLEEALKAL